MNSHEQGGGGVYDTEQYWDKVARLASEVAQKRNKPSSEGEAATAQSEAETELNSGNTAKLQTLGEKVTQVLEAEQAAEGLVADSDIENEIKAEGEAADTLHGGREELDAWLETMKQPLDKYWQDLVDEQWIETGIPINESPKIEVLLDGAKKYLREQLPELSRVGIEERAELATKVVLRDLAEKEAQRLGAAKVNRKGERVLPKDFESKLMHETYYDMRQILERFYHQNEGLRSGASDDELTEDEQIAWRVADTPRKLDMTALLDKYPRRSEEGADEYYRRLQAYTKQGDEREKQLVADAKYNAEHLKVEKAVPALHKLRDDEAEIVYSPQPLTAKRPFQDRVKQTLQAVSPKAAKDELVVQAQEEAIDQGPADDSEIVDETSMMETTINSVQKLTQVLEAQIALLEDYDPAKAEMARMLDEMAVLLVNIRARYEASAEDIEEGRRQKDLGLTPDRVEVGDSEIYRRGELALEGLYSQGVMQREQPPEVKLEFLQAFQQRVTNDINDEARNSKAAAEELAELEGVDGDIAGRKRDNLKEALRESQMKQMAYNELLDKILSATRYVEKVVRDEIPPDDTDRIVSFPSQEVLEG